MKPIRVHISTPLSAEHIGRIQSVSPRLEVTYLPYYGWAHGSDPYKPPEELKKHLAEAEVLLEVFALFDMEQAPRLRWLQVPGAGVEVLRGAPVMESDVVVTNARIFGTPIAEYVFASILCFCRHIPRAIEQVQHGSVWPHNVWDEYLGVELEGQTMSIIGYGSAGHRIARLAQGFGMSVVATRRSITRPMRDGGVAVFPPSRLHEVLAQGDFVVLCLPLTRETEEFLSEEQLRVMKPNAYLVNVGRGKLIKNSALLRALEEGWIAGAGLDVHDPTPPSSDNPFRNLPNVIMTPHMAGVTENYYSRVTDLFCENLLRYIRGWPLLNVVDKELGY